MPADPFVTDRSQPSTPSGHEDWLRPYVPRTCLRWDGDARHRRVRGTLVSADISGFTALAERLASLGREGAEALTEVLNGRFTEMIDAVDQAGGDVLKFGGDALLCLFEGADHASRAVQASVGMRDALAVPVRGAVGGRVQLSVSIGMHAGEHDLFLVPAGSFDELIVAGPGASATVRAESAASANQILATVESRADLPGECILDESPHGLVLGPIDGDVLVADQPPTSQAPQRFIVPSQRGWLEVQTPGAGEHRQAVVLFVEFSTIDGLLARQGPDAVHEALARMFEAAGEICDRLGITYVGSDVYEDGGKLILTAGVPTTTGRDEAVAVTAARALLDADCGLPLRIGLHAGHVFLGNLGAPTRRAYTVMGDTVNLAARLMAKAKPGSAVASRSLATTADTSLTLTELPPFTVKGKTQPIRAVVLGEVHDDSAASHPSGDHGVAVSAPYVGRGEELAAVASSVYLARRGLGSSLAVVGDAGTGKTRFVEEFIGRQTDLVVLRGQGRVERRATPFAAVSRAVRGALGVEGVLDEAKILRWFDRHLPERRALAPLFGLAARVEMRSTPETDRIRPEFAPDAIATLVSEVLGTLSIGGAVLVVMEDIDLADQASVALSQALMARAAEAGWLVVVTSRDLDALPHVDTVLQLSPLTDREVGDLIAQSTPLASTQIEDLIERSAGNPMFALELATTVAEGGEVSRGIEATIAQKLDRLAPKVREAVLEASVLGQEIPVELVAGALGRGLEDFEGAEAVVSAVGDRLVFEHRLFRDVAYEAIAFGRRRSLHRRVAAWLEEQRSSDVLSLAEHWGASGDRAMGWVYGVLAAEDARSKHANADAVRLYQRAIELGARQRSLSRTELARVAETLGDVAEVAGDYDVAAKAYQRANRWYGSALPARVRLMRKRGVLEERSARYGAALRWYGRAIRAIEASAGEAQDALAAEVQLGYAAARHRQGRYRDCIEWALRAADSARIGGDDRALAHAYFSLDNAYMFLGEPSDYGPRALTLFKIVHDEVYAAHTLNNMGTASYFQGRWDEALERYEGYARTMEAVGAIAFSAGGHNNAAEIFSDQGRHDEADRALDTALRGFQSVDYPIGVHLATANLGRLRCRQGDLDEAETLLRRASDGMQSIGSNYYAMVCRVRMVEWLIEKGQPQAALDDIRAMQTLGQSTDPTVPLTLARLEAMAMALLGVEAIDHSDAAVALCRRADAPYELGLTLLQHAVLARDQGAHDEARKVLDALGVRRTVRPVGADLLG